MVETIVSALAVDASSNTPLVLLKEKEGERVLPIWIGFPEASAIAMSYSYAKRDIDRPMAHDLMKLILDGLDCTLIKIEIDEIKDSTYKAKIFLQSGNKDIYIDARPSDAVALALRMKAPIFVNEALFGAESESLPLSSGGSIEELRKRLRTIEPSDFGRYNLI